MRRQLPQDVVTKQSIKRQRPRLVTLPPSEWAPISDCPAEQTDCRTPPPARTTPTLRIHTRALVFRLTGPFLELVQARPVPKSELMGTVVAVYTFYRPDALPDVQPTVSQHWRMTTSDTKSCVTEFWGIWGYWIFRHFSVPLATILPVHDMCICVL